MPDYFTLAELRALPDMGDATQYPDSRVEAVAAYVVGVIEQVVGTSFISRTVTEVHDGGGYSILLRTPYVLSVTSVTENGTAVTDDLDATDGVLERRASGTYGRSLWASGRRNVSVTYEAGYSSTPPDDIKEAALQWTRSRLLTTDSNARIDERATSVSTEMGTFGIVVAGRDRPSGYPEVDAVVMAWARALNTVTYP